MTCPKQAKVVTHGLVVRAEPKGMRRKVLAEMCSASRCPLQTLSSRGRGGERRSPVPQGVLTCAAAPTQVGREDFQRRQCACVQCGGRPPRLGGHRRHSHLQGSGVRW